MSESGLHALLVKGFRDVSELLDRKQSTLAAAPLLADLAAEVEPSAQSDEVKRAFLYALDSRELSGTVEIIQYFAHRFRWSWLRTEVEKRYLDRLANGDHRLTRHYERMLEAFSSDWEDKDLFPGIDRQ
ncbi:hypothetical protein HFP69_27095 [Streptomyces sp. ARC12]|uniref:hypothetical protein n=1 Tax=Streptomyces TaxID=1883 RepID=UPI003413311D